MRLCAASMSGPPPLQSPDQLLEDLNPPQREAVLPRRGPAPGPRRRGLGQDAGHHPPGGAPGPRPAAWRRGASSPSPSPTRRRGEMRERLEKLLGPWSSELNVGHLPLRLGDHPPAGGGEGRAHPLLRHLRRQRPAAAGEAGDARGAGRSGAQPARRAPPHRRGEERWPRAQPRRGRPRRLPWPGGAAGVPRLPGAPPRGQRASTSATCSSSWWSCSARTPRSGRSTGAASSTCWSTSSRTPTRSSTSC